MACKPCVQKYAEKYKAHGFDEKTAWKMARKLVKRVEQHRRRENWRSIRTYWRMKLISWCFLTQWRATFWWSFKHKRLCWIGREIGSPDYTQNCSGTCITENCDSFGQPCGSGVDCYEIDPTCAKNTCDCPAPLANSHEVSDSCACKGVGNKCTVCAPVPQTCSTRTFTCTCQYTCGYDCDSGYTWNGSACVLAGAGRKSMLGDGSNSIINNA